MTILPLLSSAVGHAPQAVRAGHLDRPASQTSSHESTALQPRPRPGVHLSQLWSSFWRPRTDTTRRCLAPCTQISPGQKQAAGAIHIHSGHTSRDSVDSLFADYKRTAYLLGLRLPPLLISQTLERGAYGKFRLAVNKAGDAFAVKEMRTTDWQRSSLRVGAQKCASTHPMLRQDILREARFAALSEGALAFYDLISIDEKVYGVLPYYEGGDVCGLSMHLQARRQGLKGAASLTAFVGRAVARDLMWRHGQGVAHNDVRTENMFWSPAYEVVLADFGKNVNLAHEDIARPRLTTQTSHLAPESFDNSAVLSTKVDIFALGVSLFDVFLSGGHYNINPFNQHFTSYFAASSSEFVPPPQVQTEGVDTWAAFYRQYAQTGGVVCNGAYANGTRYAEFEVLLRNFEDEDKAQCDFITLRMLNPRPELRADAAEVYRFFDAHLAPKRIATAQGLMRRTFRDPSYLTDRKAHLAALRHKAKSDALLASPKAA